MPVMVRKPMSFRGVLLHSRRLLNMRRRRSVGRYVSAAKFPVTTAALLAALSESSHGHSRENDE